jgi:hypothetical protein
MPTPKPTPEEARTLLADAPEAWKAFWFNHGAVAANLRQLAEALEAMSPEQFAHHVNEEKNDVACWVNEVVGDATLSKKLRLLSSLQATHKTVAGRVGDLDAIAAAAEPATEAPPAEASATAEAAAPAAEAPVETKTVKAAAKPAAKKAAKKTVKAAAKPAAKAAAKKAATGGEAKKDDKPQQQKPGSVWSRLLKR